MTHAYACYSTIDDERARSSSGGVFPLAARKVLSMGGTVFAACYDEKLEVAHREIISPDRLAEAQGSKYVCSRLGDSFKAVRARLMEGKTVLFCGTSCQCAGLRSYLDACGCGREKLIQIDFVCHGVPGYVPWRAYLEGLKKKGFDPVSVNMRDKESGWTRSNYSWRLKSRGGEEKLIHRSQVSFMKGMLADLFNRPSCYACRFKGTERDTDITLGDYWGVWRLLPEMDDNRGTSLVLVHSGKGAELFSEISEDLKLADAQLQGAVEANGCIVHSIKPNAQREAFFKMLAETGDFDKTVAHFTKESTSAALKRKAKSAVKRLLGRK